MKKRSKSGVRCFTRWSRKGYGAFASLGKVVKIGVLSLSMSIITLNAKSASAQPDTVRLLREMEIEALQVTAERLNPTRGVVTPTAVYSRDTLGIAPQQTIEGVLRLNPAIDVRERGGKGVQADISLRGGTYDQTMVLLNGIDFTDARTGHQSHSLPVDIDIIGSIDIIEGLTGIGAYAGAVNMVTTPLRPNYMRTEISTPTSPEPSLATAFRYWPPVPSDGVTDTLKIPISTIPIFSRVLLTLRLQPDCSTCRPAISDGISVPTGSTHSLSPTSSSIRRLRSRR